MTLRWLVVRRMAFEFIFFFFFQAEDGIRDKLVTGVQTCALPIYGRGYRTSDENAGREREIGVIPVDSSFSPVVRVKYEIEETRVGQRTNYDKLLMEIWTNGTISPQLAVVEGAKILRKHLNPFIQYAEPGPEMPIEERPESIVVETIDAELERKLNMS